MADRDLNCWKCNAPLVDVLLPFSRLAECRACHAPLHVCRMCEFFDPRRGNQCREPVAERVTEKERANFCGYFRPRAGVHTVPDGARAQAARDDLNDLFGLAGDSQGGDDSLFPAEQARKKLENLFKK